MHKRNVMRKSCIHSVSFRFCLSSVLISALLSGCCALHRETRYDDNTIKYTAETNPRTTTVYRSSPDGQKYSSSPSVKKTTVCQYESATAYYNLHQRGADFPETQVVRVKSSGNETATAEKRIMVLELSDVLFDFDKAVIKVEYVPELDKWVDYFLNHPDASASIYGHADSTGPEIYNQGLSERRAQAVMKYLINHGVPADKLSTEGFGETKPVADNATKEGRQKNRRVEMAY